MLEAYFSCVIVHMPLFRAGYCLVQDHATLELFEKDHQRYIYRLVIYSGNITNTYMYVTYLCVFCKTYDVLLASDDELL